MQAPPIEGHNWFCSWAVTRGSCLAGNRSSAHEWALGLPRGSRELDLAGARSCQAWTPTWSWAALLLLRTQKQRQGRAFGKQAGPCAHSEVHVTGSASAKCTCEHPPTHLPGTQLCRSPGTGASGCEGHSLCKAEGDISSAWGLSRLDPTRLPLCALGKPRVGAAGANLLVKQ